MLRRILHMALLSVLTRVMNVGNQASSAFVTSSSPFCDSSGQFFQETKECHVYQLGPNIGISGRFARILLTIIPPSPILLS